MEAPTRTASGLHFSQGLSLEDPGATRVATETQGDAVASPDPLRGMDWSKASSSPRVDPRVPPRAKGSSPVRGGRDGRPAATPMTATVEKPTTGVGTWPAGGMRTTGWIAPPPRAAAGGDCIGAGAVPLVTVTLCR